MRESEFRTLQTKEWVAAELKLPLSCMKVLVCYLDTQQQPVHTTAFYVKPRTIPKGDKGIKANSFEEYNGKLWIRGGFYEQLANTDAILLEVRVVAWQFLPRTAPWMVGELMAARQKVAPTPLIQR